MLISISCVKINRIDLREIAASVLIRVIALTTRTINLMVVLYTAVQPSSFLFMLFWERRVFNCQGPRKRVFLGSRKLREKLLTIYFQSCYNKHDRNSNAGLSASVLDFWKSVLYSCFSNYKEQLDYSFTFLLYTKVYCLSIAFVKKCKIKYHCLAKRISDDMRSLFFCQKTKECVTMTHF